MEKRFEVTYKHSRWLVNDKRLEELNEDERNFLNDFFSNYKASIELLN